MKPTPGTHPELFDSADYALIRGPYSRFGRSSADVACGFCNRQIEVFLWSLAGSGKKCECGALLHSGGRSYRLKSLAK